MAESETKEGLGAALGGVEVGAPMPPKVQLPLPALDIGAQGAGGAGGSDGGQRGAGRPRGSKNKRTEEWQEYLLGRYTSPLEGLAVLVSRGIRFLSIELGCSLLEAARLYIVCCKELAPYLHQKQPVSVDLSDHKKITLLFEGLSLAGEGEGFHADAEETIIIDGKLCETSAEVDAALGPDEPGAPPAPAD